MQLVVADHHLLNPKRSKLGGTDVDVADGRACRQEVFEATIPSGRNQNVQKNNQKDE